MSSGVRDAIVIGAGVNGLATAALLAKSGRSVLVLEARDRSGGVAAREEFAPGFSAPGVLHETSAIHGGVVEQLELERHGLRLATAPDDVLIAEAQGRGLLLFGDTERARAEIAARSPRDAEAYVKWRAFLARVRAALARVFHEPAPELFAPTPGDLAALLFTGLKLRRLGESDLLELARIVPMCVADWLREHFEDPLLCSALAAPATRGGLGGPWAPGTAGALLFADAAGSVRFSGGASALSDALAKACAARNVEIRTSAAVREIRIEIGAVRGVVLADGSSEDARIVIAACEPKQALLELIPARKAPAQLAREISTWRTRGTTAIVRLGLKGRLRFRSRPDEDVAHALVAGDLDHIERAFDAIKYKRCADDPWLDVRVPSLADATLAPAGHQVVTIEAHATPYDLEGGWTQAARARLDGSVLASLGRVATLEPASIVAREVLAPVDLEQRYGLTGGHIHHGETSLDQMLFMRPGPSLARHATPVAGLFLCGRGTHPGPQLACGAAALAADAVAKYGVRAIP